MSFSSIDRMLMEVYYWVPVFSVEDNGIISIRVKARRYSTRPKARISRYHYYPYHAAARTREYLLVSSKKDKNSEP